MIGVLGRKFGNLIALLFSDDVRDRIYLERRLKALPLVGRFFRSAARIRAKFFQRTSEDYLKMQKAAFERYASADRIDPGNIEGDYVVGSWRQHDEWPDYEQFLMRYVPRNETWLALDYGCGPGRNLRRWSSFFARIDGVDISARNLENAKAFLREEIPAHKRPNLYLTSGNDCGEALKEHYDFVFSTICLQHICVHSVRFSILASLFSCLKPGGRISIQMGYGLPSPNTVGYFEDHVVAAETNRACDVAIGSPDEVRADFDKIGFEDFESCIRPVGPGDVHPHWIYVTATRPVRK